MNNKLALDSDTPSGIDVDNSNNRHGFNFLTSIAIPIALILAVSVFNFLNTLSPANNDSKGFGGPAVAFSTSNPIAFSLYSTMNSDDKPENSNGNLNFYFHQTNLLANQEPQISEAKNGKRGVAVYGVGPDDNLWKIASKFDISVRTILWANPNIKTDSLKTGQELLILPVDGVLHRVVGGETLDEISDIYKVSAELIARWNKSINPTKLAAGIDLVIPGGIPKKPINDYKIDVKDYFVPPVSIPPGYISQGLHPNNAIDFAIQCGYPIFASYDGTVIEARRGWNSGYGNYVDILHEIGSGFITTRYSHLQTILISEGLIVSTGDKIGLVGDSGNSTGCHVHFEVYGARNPFAK